MTRATTRARTRGLVLGLLMLVYAGVVVWLTLRPERVDARVHGALDDLFAFARVHHLAWLDFAFVEWVSNVALFVPAGTFLAVLLPGRYRWAVTVAAVAVGAVVSGGIELGQALFLPDRVPSWADVAANTLGTAIGAGLVALVRAVVAVLRGPRVRRSRIER